MKLSIFIREVGIWLTHYLEVSDIDRRNSSVYDTCAICADHGRHYRTSQMAERNVHEHTHTQQEIDAYLEKRSKLLTKARIKAAQ
jgi:hypothetical protein